MAEENKGKLELIATKTLKAHDELYILVDFLNKNLKDHKVMFGLTKNSAEGTMTVSIYEV
ncbi:YpmA family protein [Zhaonella formicivorans]|uniref:YpmA family protein n=1 Tax=Zhaonella formicivorans TaxID=2528593 RepID=UPI0010F3CF8C|nr:YpmA family protein [Zhaonella formicivorans]